MSILLFAANVLLFFASVLLHELAHVAALNVLGMRPRHVTLWGFGGYITLNRKPRSPGAWALINVAGPAASALIGFALLAVTPAIPGGISGGVVSYWARLNLFLAALNALPVYWFDGCDLVGAALWRVTGDQSRARRISTRVGLIAAVAVAIAAFVPGATFGLVSPLIIAFIAAYEAAAALGELRAHSGEGPLPDRDQQGLSNLAAVMTRTR
jgi:Zn-dependent protease